MNRLILWADVPDERRHPKTNNDTWRGCEAAVQGRTVAPDYWPYWRCSVPAIKGTSLCRRHQSMLEKQPCPTCNGSGRVAQQRPTT
jgi:hypothetical protein